MAFIPFTRAIYFSKRRPMFGASLLKGPFEATVRVGNGEKQLGTRVARR